MATDQEIARAKQVDAAKVSPCDYCSHLMAVEHVLIL